mmetsp:Transcript_2149/g.5446  ORF Transcript_2149/g.5446 Transcript_2149/m.5446 type:complete len:265 (-) Transcript_2149:82-876(-)
MSTQGKDTLNLQDGTTMQIARLPDVDDSMWGEMKSYLESNPEIAKGLQNFSKDPNAMRGWLQTQAIAEHYQASIQGDEEGFRERLQALEEDEDLKGVFGEIKTNGLEAVLKYWHDEELLQQVNERMGGLPVELQSALKKIEATSLSMHEAAKNGDLKALMEYVQKRHQPIDTRDLEGVTPLGYAIGYNQTAVCNFLMENGADLRKVDSAGNTALHYAAGYGQKALVERLLATSADAKQANSEGQTPCDLARLNGHEALIPVLTR